MFKIITKSHTKEIFRSARSVFGKEKKNDNKYTRYNSIQKNNMSQIIVAKQISVCVSVVKW